MSVDALQPLTALVAAFNSLHADLRAMAVAMGAIGPHVGECRTPDEPCSCGVAGAREDAARLVAETLARHPQRQVPS